MIRKILVSLAVLAFVVVSPACSDDEPVKSDAVVTLDAASVKEASASDASSKEASASDASSKEAAAKDASSKEASASDASSKDAVSAD